ncbi:hypothetical protein HDZ31DRAFT_59671 [Schizophyllum fasciatum]
MQLHASQAYTRQCPLKNFYDAYIYSRGYTKVPTMTIARITDTLRKRGIINCEGQWAKLMKRGLLENVHFAGLQKIFDDVISVASDTYPSRFDAFKKTTNFGCRPNYQTASEVPGASFRVDALNCLSQSSYPHEVTAGTAHNYTATAAGQKTPVTIYTADTAVSWEFKMHAGNDDILLNEQHTLNTAQHILFNDIRRTCHFAVTIEADGARLWYHTRSHTVITERFDIHEHPEELIKFILFSTFATEAQLGFDSTVRRVVVDNELHYEFDIIHRKGTRGKYRSVKIEHENPAAELYSRAMRVFKVVRSDIDESGRFYVLRDYWLFNDKDTSEEAAIQEEILGALERTMPADEFLALRRHFMTILADGVVCHKGFKDEVPCPPAAAKPYKYGNEHNPNNTTAREPKVTIANRGVDASYHGPEREKEVNDFLLQLHGRKHCRTVYDEHCKDLWQVNDPAMFFFALSQVIYILDKLRLVGYMHRDVSLGNFMLYRLANVAQSTALCDQYVTKIADLEYARSYGKTTQHDPITGTSMFIAIEVQASEHLFFNTQDDELMARNYFVFNPLHDVESALWMAIFFALHRCSRHVFDNTDWNVMRARIEGVRTFARRVFVNKVTGSKERRHLIQNSRDNRISREHLEYLYGDDSSMVKLADAVRQLRNTYRAVEDSATITQEEEKQFDPGNPHVPRLPLSVFHDNAGIYDLLREIFGEISQRFVDAKDPAPLIKFSDIDFSTGKLASDIASPAPGVDLVEPMTDDASAADVDAAPAAPAAKKTTGKRKKVDEEEGEREREAGSSSKRRASTKRSRRTQETPAAASDKSGGRSASRNGQPVVRGRARTKSGPKPPAQPTRRSTRLAGLPPGQA